MIVKATAKHDSQEKAVYIWTEGPNIHSFYSMNFVHTVKTVGVACYSEHKKKSQSFTRGPPFFKPPV